MCINCDLQASLINQNNAMTIAALAGAAKDLSLHVNHGSETQIKEILQTISQLSYKAEPVKAAQVKPARRSTDQTNTAGQADAAASLANQPLAGKDAPRRADSKDISGLLSLLTFLKAMEKGKPAALQPGTPDSGYEYKLVAPEGASYSEVIAMRDHIAKDKGIDEASIQIVQD